MKKNLSKNDYRDICEGCIVLSIFIYFRQFLQQAFQVLWDIFGPSGYYRVTDTDHLPTPPDSSFNVYWTVKLQKTVEFRKLRLFHCMFGMIFLNFWCLKFLQIYLSYTVRLFIRHNSLNVPYNVYLVKPLNFNCSEFLVFLPEQCWVECL